MKPVYLIVGQEGVRRMTKTKPELARDEIAVRVRVNMSNAHFRSLILDADLDVPDEALIAPDIELEAEYKSQID